MSNVEIPNDEGNPNDEARMGDVEGLASFVIRNATFLRRLKFIIRHFP
jgi:hypothetical protein